MRSKFTRRKFLATAASAATLGASSGLASPQSSVTNAEINGSYALPLPDDAPFDTVVILMMENRSFDHLLGWLPGANGRQEGLSYADENGVVHDTWPLAPDYQGCQYQDPDHTWKGIAIQYADGRCDGFLQNPHRPQRFQPTFTRSAITARMICRSLPPLRRTIRHSTIISARCRADVGKSALSADRAQRRSAWMRSSIIFRGPMPSDRAPFRRQSSIACARPAYAPPITITASR